jgi:uncharacterized protein (TIGR03435 family)
MTTKMVLAGLALFALRVFGQTPAAPRFLAADVHPSPPQRYPFFQQMPVYHDHTIMKGATLVDLVATAYGVDVLDVQGGPTWLERRRFDIDALAPPKASKDDSKLMLRALLAERFKLVVHTGSKEVPAYVLSLGKDKPRMKAATDPDAQVGCEFKGTDAPNSYIDFHCHNMSMAGFLNDLQDWAGDYLKLPVTDATGLKGGWDFDIKWTGKDQLVSAGADAIPIFDAVQRQLGLKLELKTTPRTVVIVDSVNPMPTANAANLDKLLPPTPAATLEVATIKPANPDQHLMIQITPDSMNLRHVTVRRMIQMAWDLSGSDKDVPVNAPKWLDQDAFDIVAKVGVDTPGEVKPPLIPIVEFHRLLRELLADRFGLKTHMESLPMNGYKLVAVNPKLKPADPASRTHCVEGPGPDGKDPRLANPVLTQLVSCQNVTMAEFGEELMGYADDYIYTPVLDATGLTGGWDFTLSFSSARELNAGAEESTPNGALSLFEAITKQLGLKLEKDRRPMSVLVIDHVDEKPTEN